MLNVEQGLADGVRLYEQYRGWYLDLPDKGEQVVNPAALGAGQVFFNTFQPEGGSKGFCSDLGRSKSYRLSLFRPEKTEGEDNGEGLSPPPIIQTVRLRKAEPVDQRYAGDGELSRDEVTKVLNDGREFEEIQEMVDGTLREVYRVEDIDRLE